jgi:hypothetical protein
MMRRAGADGRLAAGVNENRYTRETLDPLAETNTRRGVHND